jgi:hypothetical protein
MQRTIINREQVGLLAKVMRARKPTKATETMVALEWYAIVRDIAQCFFPVTSDEWYEFVTECGYLDPTI